MGTRLESFVDQLTSRESLLACLTKYIFSYLRLMRKRHVNIILSVHVLILYSTSIMFLGRKKDKPTSVLNYG